MLFSEKPNVMFYRPQKMGDCMYVRHRQKMFVPLGASLRVHVNNGPCTGLLGAESGSWYLWHLQGYLLKNADLQGQGSGA